MIDLDEDETDDPELAEVIVVEWPAPIRGFSAHSLEGWEFGYELGLN